MHWTAISVSLRTYTAVAVRPHDLRKEAEGEVTPEHGWFTAILVPPALIGNVVRPLVDAGLVEIVDLDSDWSAVLARARHVW